MTSEDNSVTSEDNSVTSDLPPVVRLTTPELETLQVYDKKLQDETSGSSHTSGDFLIDILKSKPVHEFPRHLVCSHIYLFSAYSIYLQLFEKDLCLCESTSLQMCVPFFFNYPQINILV